jgi:hypothetical protein
MLGSSKSVAIHWLSDSLLAQVRASTRTGTSFTLVNIVQLQLAITLL